jgi:hypothetical protein
MDILVCQGLFAGKAPGKIYIQEHAFSSPDINMAIAHRTLKYILA